MSKHSHFKKILILGSGILGGAVLDFLAQSGQPYDITVGGRNAEKTWLRINLAKFAATNLGHMPKLSFVEIDVMNVEETASAIETLAPDLIFNATTLHSWWVITQLPAGAYQRIDAARGGVWTPMHLVLTRRLMKAVKLSGVTAHVVNASYPDVVNAALAAEGLAPSIGIGNIANTVPVLRYAAAYILEQDPSAVQIRVFGQHYFSYRMPSSGTAKDIPYHLAIYLYGELQPTDTERDEAIFSTLTGPFKRVRGLAGQSVTATSATRVIRALIDDGTEIVHAPGPLGLVGGYPVQVTQGSLSIALPEGMTLAGAVDINRRCQVLDGIADVGADGSVRYTPESAGILKEELGYDCELMHLDECEERAAELAAKFGEYYRRLGDDRIRAA
jgi:hypothetical protein